MPLLLFDWFCDKAEKQIGRHIVPGFWKHFPESPTLSRKALPPPFEKNCLLLLHEAVGRLHMEVMPLLRGAKLVDDLYGASKPHQSCASVVLENLLGVITTYPRLGLFPIVKVSYRLAFKAFQLLKSREDPSSVSVAPPLMDEDDGLTDIETLSEILSYFERINSQLNDMGLVDALSGQAVTEVCHGHIQEHVVRSCRSACDTALLANFENWIKSSLPLHLFPHAQVKNRLLFFMYESFAHSRIDQLFNIIVEFPDSKPALEDLRDCMEKVTDMRGRLVSSLKEALQTRLLHPGVNTTEILTFYIEAIRALRFLDPSGVILELVCLPVRSYLRHREDTVRCIVQSLTDESSGSELANELFTNHELCEIDDAWNDAAPDHDLADWQSWTPDPVDADPAKSSRQRRSADIISMLVNIYGSRELFVNAYRTLLADRILTASTFDLDKERRHLELLKRRFGESQMHYCEVILKDVEDSRRINKHIQESAPAPSGSDQENVAPSEVPLNAYVISGQFWPQLREEKLKLPEPMEKAMEKFTGSYEALKGNRTLHWKPHLGFVNLYIELKDGKKLNVSVSPVHASIIQMFEDQDRWTTEDLASKLGMTTALLRRRITLWQSHGLLKEESADLWVLHEDRPLSGGAVLSGKGADKIGDTFILDPEDELEPATATAQDLREEELNTYWSYIEGMLRNLESMTIERIHSMLKMFASNSPGGNWELELPELKSFLSKKIKDQKLVYVSGVYRLPGK